MIDNRVEFCKKDFSLYNDFQKISTSVNGILLRLITNAHQLLMIRTVIPKF